MVLTLDRRYVRKPPIPHPALQFRPCHGALRRARTLQTVNPFAFRPLSMRPSPCSGSQPRTRQIVVLIVFVRTLSTPVTENAEMAKYHLPALRLLMVYAVSPGLVILIDRVRFVGLVP